LPTRTNWDEEEKQLKEGLKLTVISSANGSDIQLKNHDEIKEAILNKTIDGSNLCYSYKFSSISSLREVCNDHFSLRKLYDPVGAYSPKVSKFFGIVFIVLHLIAWLTGGIIKLGSPFLLYALFGILAVVLTPTVIGLFIVYLIARSVGVPLLGSYLGVLLFCITTAISFGIGYGLGHVIMWFVAKIIKLDDKKVVDWDLVK